MTPQHDNLNVTSNPYRAYVGAKIILAAPKKQDGKEGYEVVYSDGYTSWSPKAVFEEAYRPVNDGEDAHVRTRWPQSQR